MFLFTGYLLMCTLPPTAWAECHFPATLSVEMLMQSSPFEKYAQGYTQYHSSHVMSAVLLLEATIPILLGSRIPYSYLAFPGKNEILTVFQLERVKLISSQVLLIKKPNNWVNRFFFDSILGNCHKLFFLSKLSLMERSLEDRAFLLLPNS